MKAKKSKSLSWDVDSNDSDHLYELIRGVPSVIVSNKAPTVNKEYKPKRNLIEPNQNFIGPKISKTGQNSFERLLLSTEAIEKNATAKVVLYHGTTNQMMKITSMN